MNDFGAMADYLAFHPKGTSKSLYKAIIDVESKNYSGAYHHIAKAQALAHDELQGQLDLGPQVALKTLAKTECLVELNEVIQYRSQPDMRDHILSVWRARFKRSHDDPNSWLKRLQVWTLACPPATPGLQHCWLDCAKLCEQHEMHEIAQGILTRLTPAVHPPVSATCDTPPGMISKWMTDRATGLQSRVHSAPFRVRRNSRASLGMRYVDKLTMHVL